MAAATPIDTQVKLLGTDLFCPSDRVGGEPKAFVQAVDSVQSDFAENAVDLLLERFIKADGIEDLRSTALGKVGVRYLFSLESPFHTKAVRARLKQISVRAASESVVQVNFYTYLRALTDGAIGESWGSNALSRMDCQGLLDDRALVRVIWKAAVTGKLNARMTGTLRTYREVLLKRGIQERDVPLPAWWKRLERTFFSQTEPSTE